MYKSYNSEPKSLSPHKNFDFHQTAEKLVPFLIIAATFVWLWK